MAYSKLCKLNNILLLTCCRFKSNPYFWDFFGLKVENIQQFLPLVKAFLNFKSLEQIFDGKQSH